MFSETNTLTGQNRVNAFPNPISVQINRRILVEGYKNILQNQGKMARISLRI